MFNGKSKTDGLGEAPTGTSTSLIGAGTSMKGDITSNGDLRIDGTLTGNIHCSAKVVIGANGVVHGNLLCKAQITVVQSAKDATLPGVEADSNWAAGGVVYDWPLAYDSAVGSRRGTAWHSSGSPMSARSIVR